MRHVAFILHRLFAATAALSFMLLLVAVGWWVRSYSTADDLTSLGAAGQTSVISSKGEVHWWRHRRDVPPSDDTWSTRVLVFGIPQANVPSLEDRPLSSPWLGVRWADFREEWDRDDFTERTHVTVRIVPLAWFVAVTAVLPAAWVALRVVRRCRARDAAAAAPRASPRERALGASTLLSAVACAVTVTAWGRSLHWHEYTASWDSHVTLQVRSLPLRSALELAFDRPPQTPDAAGSGYVRRSSIGWEHYWIPPDRRDHHPPELEVFPGFRSDPVRTQPQGIGLSSGDVPDPRVTGRRVSVPYWSIVLLTVLLPAWRGLRWWRRRRVYGDGRCPRCGYDLRASPQRCPECGQPVAQGTPAPAAHAEFESPG